MKERKAGEERRHNKRMAGTIKEKNQEKNDICGRENCLFSAFDSSCVRGMC